MRGWSPVATGLGFLPVLVTIVVASTLAPRLIARAGARAGLALIGAGALVMAGISARGGYTGAILPGGVLYGTALAVVAAAVVGSREWPLRRARS